MRALVVLLAATGISLLVTFFWRQQLLGRVEPMPPLVAQLARLVEEGALGGLSPEQLVATLVFSEPFKEADPWDLAPRRKGGMSAMFGEPREIAFLGALGREPRTAGWRLDGPDAASAGEAQAQMSAALAWAAEKGVRLRVVAHGAAVYPVLRAALAAPEGEAPTLERLLGVGVRLADIKAREPALAEALEARAPAGQWFNLFSEASVVPRELGLERVTPGAPPELQELAWPGSSWVPTVVGLVQRGAPQAAPAMPSAAPGSQLSVRQFRAVKDGTITQRTVDGKGNLVSGSLLVPKLDKEEIPPDPEAGENKVGDPSGAAPANALPNRLIPVKATGWVFRVPAGLEPAHRDFNKCQPCMLLQEPFFRISLDVDAKGAPQGLARSVCARAKGGTLVAVVHRGYKGEICKQGAPYEGRSRDNFTLHSGESRIELAYDYPVARRGEKLDLFMKAIEALELSAKK